MKNRSRIIPACTCKDPHVLHFLKISALSRVFPQEMDIKITACSRVWGRIMHVALLDFHACIRKYSSLCDACTRMSVCGNTCVYTHSISRIYMRFYEDHVWLGRNKISHTIISIVHFERLINSFKISFRYQLYYLLFNQNFRHGRNRMRKTNAFFERQLNFKNARFSLWILEKWNIYWCWNHTDTTKKWND